MISPFFKNSRVMQLTSVSRAFSEKLIFSRLTDRLPLPQYLPPITKYYIVPEFFKYLPTFASDLPIHPNFAAS